MNKPTVEQILEIYDKSKDVYVKSGLQEALSEDNRYYELDFANELNIPSEFKKDATVLPTARDRVDSLVDHTDISHARVFVNKKGTSESSTESQEMLRKFALGLINRTNVESDISPLRVSAKHYWLHGVTWIKTVWDADNWYDRPFKKDGESEEAWAGRIDEWRNKTHDSLPIVIQAVNPANIIPDPYHAGRDYVFEVRKKLVYDAKRLPFKWDNPDNKKEGEEIEQIEYSDRNYRCILIDRKPVWKVDGGVIEHNYGFLPYTAIESGLGNVDIESSPVKRYVGIIRYMKRLLVSQSSIYSMCDILTKLETMIGGYITGADASTIPKITQAYGKWYPMGDKDVKFNRWERNLSPREAYAHLAYITDMIDIHSAPKSMFGLGEEGVRSGADRRLVLAEAQSKLNYSKDAFANGWAQVLNKCARLVKNVIPGDFEIWTRTPSDEFDVVVKKSLFKEPFNFYVEFSPISEEDEYRRHEDLMRMFASGLYTKQHARGKLSDVDIKALEKQELKELLKGSPAYLQTLSDVFVKLVQQALLQTGLVPITPEQPGQPPQGGTQGGTTGRPLTTNTPQQTPPGQQMVNNINKEIGRPKLNANQGMGGGGNRSFGV
uniref:Portal protein n=1 Tax=viral metagenome TaxID=1070528 RepID=A0A6M3JAV3_9ZZZZ